VNVYRKQRDDLLTLARRIAEEEQNKATASPQSDERPPKRRRTQQTNGASTMSEIPIRATRSRSRRALQGSPRSEERSVVEDSEDDGSQYLEDSSSLPDKPSSAPDDGLVACPMCNNRMKEDAVFTHLDQCDGVDRSSIQQKDPMTTGKQSTSVAYSILSPTKARQRLGALNYSLLTETALRRKLAEIGIPSYGPKPLMQRRHMEWMNLWNASCDSTNPEPKRELLRELDLWERTQGRHIMNAQGPSGVMAKNFDPEGWTKSNKHNFVDLVRKARDKAHKPMPNETRAGDGGAPEIGGRPQSPESSPRLDQSLTGNSVVDLSSPTKPALEQQESQGSQMNGVAA
jgi:E3 ubiquitin-protein ligase RAD18